VCGGNGDPLWGGHCRGGEGIVGSGGKIRREIHGGRWQVVGVCLTGEAEATKGPEHCFFSLGFVHKV